MTISNAPPSGNPAGKYDLRSLLRLWWTKNLQKLDDMLPAKVIAYDAATNTAQVQPLISVVTTDNQLVQRAQVASVPVFQLSMGGFILNLPCNSGDLGWIKANDRDISLFMQTGQMSPPNTQRKHSFEDAMFIPQALRSLVTIASEDAGNMVLQNNGGTVKIALWPTLIKILAPAGVGIGDTPNAHAERFWICPALLKPLGFLPCLPPKKVLSPARRLDSWFTTQQNKAFRLITGACGHKWFKHFKLPVPRATILS